MRFNFRIKIRGWTLFGMLSKTQTMMGFTSLIKNVGNVMSNIHYIMWDLEGATFDEVKKELLIISNNFCLGEIFIVGESVKQKSFRAWCFQPVTFRKMVEIINATNYVDYLFFKYTILRGKATLRISQKAYRPPQRILYRIEGKKYRIPKTMERVIYDTGFIKDAKNFIMEI